mmetsp:Transcript_16122/g.45145  ORF Transcript_16122/g.45145 Transcript_16122/m.45145 type:complete len:213 (-) Transcript_16122:83-721(-)
MDVPFQTPHAPLHRQVHGIELIQLPRACCASREEQRKSSHVFPSLLPAFRHQTPSEFKIAVAFFLAPPRIATILGSQHQRIFDRLRNWNAVSPIVILIHSKSHVLSRRAADVIVVVVIASALVDSFVIVIPKQGAAVAVAVAVTVIVAITIIVVGNSAIGSQTLRAVLETQPLPRARRKAQLKLVLHARWRHVIEVEETTILSRVGMIRRCR